jgi:ribonuclease III
MTLQYPRRQKQLESFIARLGLSPEVSIQWRLLDLALTHTTSSATDNYEQLEFVGDAVVKLAAAAFLLRTYPQLKVGDFTALRSVLVSDQTLAEIADSYGFDRFLLIGASADAAGRMSRLADSLEAVLAAFYLSTHTLDLIHPWLDSHFQHRAETILADPARQNYKAALQNWTQGHHQGLPEYRSQEVKQVHNDPERFYAEVYIQGTPMGSGIGRSIKAAEQAAARVAFLALREQGEASGQDS